MSGRGSGVLGVAPPHFNPEAVVTTWFGGKAQAGQSAATQTATFAPFSRNR